MSITAAVLACAIQAVLAVLQLALAGGAPLGHFAWGGQHRVLPRNLRIGSLFAIGLYVLFSAIILQRAGLVSILPRAMVDFGIWAVLAFLALGIPGNALSRSRAERFTMTPVVIVLFILVLVVAMGW